MSVLSVPWAGRDSEGGLEQVGGAGRAADQSLVLDRFDAPGRSVRIVPGQVPCTHREGDRLLLARHECDPGKTAQELERAIHLRVRETHVELYDFFTASRAGVGYIRGYRQLSVRRHLRGHQLEVGILERGVTQAITKRERRFEALLLRQRSEE